MRGIEFCSHLIPWTCASQGGGGPSGPSRVAASSSEGCPRGDAVDDFLGVDGGGIVAFGLRVRNRS